MRQLFKSHSLYRFTASRQLCRNDKQARSHIPEGWDRVPPLIDYLNWLSMERGLTVFAVVCAGDDMWYEIITVEDVLTTDEVERQQRDRLRQRADDRM